MSTTTTTSNIFNILAEDQSIDRPNLNEIIVQPASESASEPASESASEPASESASEPVIQSASEDQSGFQSKKSNKKNKYNKTKNSDLATTMQNLKSNDRPSNKETAQVIIGKNGATIKYAGKTLLVNNDKKTTKDNDSIPEPLKVAQDNFIKDCCSIIDSLNIEQINASLDKIKNYYNIVVFDINDDDIIVEYYGKEYKYSKKHFVKNKKYFQAIIREYCKSLFPKGYLLFFDGRDPGTFCIKIVSKDNTKNN